MERKKIYAIEATALIIGTILVSSISAPATCISSDDFAQEQNSYSGRIQVSVKLIYGSADLPLIIPFPSVGIEAAEVNDASKSYHGITDSDGKWMHNDMRPGFYKITASKDGFVDISSGFNGFKRIKIDPGILTEVKFTLTEEGSPWDLAKSKEKASQNPISPTYTIVCFEICNIKGSYLTKSSDETNEFILTSNSKSIVMSGIAVVLDFGDIPQTRFCRISTDQVRAEEFIGFCEDGEVHGIGSEHVTIGNYNSRVRNVISNGCRTRLINKLLKEIF